MMKFLKPLLAALGLAAVGSAGASVKPDWIDTQNFNGKPATVYTSNLADIAFDDRGEIVGWYVKQTPGQKYDWVEEDQKQKDGSVIKTSVYRGTGPLPISAATIGVSLVPTESRVNNVVVQKAGRALTVNIPGNTAEVIVKPVQLVRDVAHNRMQAVFTYSQGAATVTKTVVLHPRQFNMQVDVNVTGGSPYSLAFDGLGKNANPGSKSLSQGQQVVEGPVTTQKVQYASLFDTLTFGFLGLGSNSYTAHMLVVRPANSNSTPFNVTTVAGQKASLTLTGLSGTTQLDVYGGKNELIHLYQEGYTALPGLFTPNTFGTISLYLVKFMEYLYTFLKSWGLVIFVFTILLRLAIWPLMQTQGRTTAKMQMVGPMVKEAQAKFKDDPQKLQQETMRLYKENNVNPAGCLSMFIPLPILAVLFSTFRNFEFDQGLWWLPDLSLPDPLYILAVVYVAANLLQLYVGTRKTPQMFKQQSFIYIIYLYFALTFPAGVTLYWIISTLIGAGQQYLINKQVEAQMAGGLVTGNGGTGNGGIGKGTIVVEKVADGRAKTPKSADSRSTDSRGAEPKANLSKTASQVNKVLKTTGKPATGNKK
jgi:YidC/Oxa1 family membrane protein insertase